jgi:hypothetical protein
MLQRCAETAPHFLPMLKDREEKHWEGLVNRAILPAYMHMFLEETR